MLGWKTTERRRNISANVYLHIADIWRILFYIFNRLVKIVVQQENDFNSTSTLQRDEAHQFALLLL